MYTIYLSSLWISLDFVQLFVLLKKKKKKNLLGFWPWQQRDAGFVGSPYKPRQFTKI